MGRTVLLLHQLPDGSSHLDWLMERPDSDRLISFRVRDRIDSPSPACSVQRFKAEAMPDHRRAYLEYEGPVSGERGSVSRVAAGSVDWVERSTEAIAVILDFGSGPRRAEGRPSRVASSADSPQTGAVWEFTLTSLEPNPPAR